ncbi:MAG: glycoside hydrolase family 43 protein [Rhodobacteraceae bacterium]|nr:glycoside hydrolase family 43 protein [Paracoccaceae bacterium]
MITNPILPGFNPDPSICRVGEDYYIATSTFEWYPGVQIHHSRDLVNWTLVARPLNRPDLLDMRGNPDSGGIWAPCLSHADGKFWLVYTDVKRLEGSFKDAHNYITTCETIDGDWSERVYVNSQGFDPSLFHDDDGRKWFMNVQWNHRGPGTGCNPAHTAFDGINLQEWSPEQGLIGPITNIYPGTSRGLTEAPHIFKRNGYYYLTTAEGGTGYRHAVSLARSRDIRGPYEDHPNLHVMTAAMAPENAIQRVGHGQYVETPDGEVYHTFLMGRPLPERVCPMGRETGIERCVWGEDDWLYLEDGGLVPRDTVPINAPALAHPARVAHDFADGTLPDEFQWLRTPYPDAIFRMEPGTLVLKGAESLGSWFDQALVARRQEHAAYHAETQLEFAPDTYQQGAGLTTYYNRYKFHAGILTLDPQLGRVLQVMSCVDDYPKAQLALIGEPIPIEDGPVDLAVEVAGTKQQFFWKQGGAWHPIGGVLSAAPISDEGAPGEHQSFTGAFVGMVAFDTTGRRQEARFTSFAYSKDSEGAAT